MQRAAFLIAWTAVLAGCRQQTAFTATSLTALESTSSGGCRWLLIEPLTDTRTEIASFPDACAGADIVRSGKDRRRAMAVFSETPGGYIDAAWFVDVAARPAERLP